MTSDESVRPNPPKTFKEYYSEGWALHGSNKDDDAAEENFRHAIAVDPNSADAYFGLGLVLKSQDRRQEAIDSFEKVVDILDNTNQEDVIRTKMLRRLALGHINQMRKGDWDLEKEVWGKKDESS